MTSQNHFTRIVLMSLVAVLAIGVGIAVSQCNLNQPTGWSCYHFATSNNADPAWPQYSKNCDSNGCQSLDTNFTCSTGTATYKKVVPGQQAWPVCYMKGTYTGGCSNTYVICAGMRTYSDYCNTPCSGTGYQVSVCGAEPEGRNPDGSISYYGTSCDNLPGSLSNTYGPPILQK